jgi:hypothetical protein
MSDVTISPPPKPLPFSKDNTLDAIGGYIKSDFFNYSNQLYQTLYFMWRRTGGYLSNIPITNYNLSTKGNVGTSSVNLLTYVLAANSLDDNGRSVTIQGFGSFAANGNSKSLKLLFGSSVLLQTPSLAINGGGWNVIAQVFRTNIGTQKIIVNTSFGSSLLVSGSSYVSASEDLTKDLTIAFSAVGSADNDIIQEGLIVQTI